MTADMAWQIGLAPELRLTFAGYYEEFGCPPAAVWRVPGIVTLLASGPARLTVAVPWGAIAAAGPGEDGVLELIRMERPGERDRVPIADADTDTAAVRGPAWMGGGLAAAREGTRLLVRSDLPDGVGAGAAAAVKAAIRLCLDDRAAGGGGAAHARGCAVLGARRLPCELASAGLRLMLIDTRVRRDDQSPPAEDSPVAAAAAAATAGNFALLGALLTAAHQAQPRDDVQHVAVSGALRAGALGARAITDGQGRPVCALVPVEKVADVRASVCDEFARGGHRPPRFLTFTPAAGPDRA
jgi:galactokinase